LQSMLWMSYVDWSIARSSPPTEALVVVQNPQQGEAMHNSKKGGAGQRALPFEEEEIWSALPEQVRERCRGLWRQLLASVLEPSERRLPNERED